MMKYDAILFDMDGTLVPMDMKKFMGGYFKDVMELMIPFGFKDREIPDAIMHGTAAMVAGDGTRTNKEVFWEDFEKVTGKSADELDPAFLEYYQSGFRDVKRYTLDNPYAVKAVELSRKLADKVILATNPFFPYCAQVVRANWVGLTEKNFDLITSYETEHFCKPNPKFFLEVCKKAGIDPSKCLMVGNDEYEDMYTAAQTGMDCFLITDTAIRNSEHPYSGREGSFKEFTEWLESCLEND